MGASERHVLLSIVLLALLTHADVVLDHVKIAGFAQEAGQGFIGELAEVLVFDRRVRFDELHVVRRHLRAKWSRVSH